MAQILPKSFVQRGVAVSFTSPVLAFARCRRPPGETNVEYLVPGLAGSTETYVLPYKALPEIITLSVHDRMLHESLPKLRKVTPLTIREAVCRVALTGLSGPIPMRRAREEIASAKARPLAIMVALVYRAIKQLAANEPEVADLDEANLGTPEGLSLARKALSGYAQGAGLTAGDIMSRLEDWGKITAPLGGPGETHLGSLGKTIQENDALAASMTKWLIPEPPDTGEMAQRTALAAKEASTVARKATALIDSAADELSETLANWQTARKEIADGVDKISLVMDGWERINTYWRDAESMDRFRQRTTIESFAQYLPMLPEEAASDAVEMWEALRESQARWNQSAQTKLSQHLDPSVREKLSQFRKEAT